MRRGPYSRIHLLLATTITNLASISLRFVLVLFSVLPWKNVRRENYFDWVDSFKLASSEGARERENEVSTHRR